MKGETARGNDVLIKQEWAKVVARAQPVERMGECRDLWVPGANTY